MATFEESAPKRLILGSARSGTTWVLDCLAEANDLRPIFEPLDPLESKLTARHANDCMASDDSNPELERLFRNLAAGSVHSRWIDYRGPRRLWLPRPEGNPRGTAYAKRWLRQWRSYLRTHMMMRTAVRRKETLIKCVRANLMASWLAQTIGFRIALIVRHPCAVVESQYRLRSPIVRNPGPVLARYRASERLHQQTGGRYLSLLHAELTTIEALTLNWVIENQWPIEQSEEAGYVDRDGDKTLVLDPVDGTHNAIRGVPAYAVSMAIGRERLSDVEEGLVRDLVTGASFHARKGRGTTLNGRPIRVRRFVPDDSLFSVYLGTNAAPDAARVASKARRVRNLGAASLDMCLVARGAADLYYMHTAVHETKLRVVDIAASTLIVREAGGAVETLDGGDVDLALRTGERTDLVAFGDARAREAIR